MQEVTKPKPKDIAPDTEVDLTNWVTPFLGYGSFPYTLHKDYQTKVFPILLEQVGSFLVELRQGTGISRNGRGILILPWENRAIDLESLSQHEETIESKLLAVSIYCYDPQYLIGVQKLTHKVELKTLCGEVFQNLFEDLGGEGLPIANMSDWHRNGEQGDCLLVPEFENVLERIQISMSPIGSVQNIVDN